MLDVALRMLLHDRGKFAITLAGVAFAVTLVLVQVGLFRGILSNATITIERADADLWVTSKNTPNVDFPQYFSQSLVKRVRSIPGVARADNLLVAYMAMQLPSGAAETLLVYGLDDPRAWRLPWSVTEGNADAMLRGSSILLDDSATRRFGAFRVGERRELIGHRVDIVGRTSEALSFTTMPIAFTAIDVAESIQPELLSDRTAYVLVKLEPGADSKRVAAEIRRRLPYNDVYARQEWAERSRNYWVVHTGMGMNMAITVFLGILIGITVVAQTLYAATLDHTREFGTLKAMGATTSHVCGLVATQAGVCGLLGFVLAIPIVFAMRLAARQIGLEVVLSIPFVVTVLIGSLVSCVGASLLTFRRIASIDPALVFRT